MYIKILIYDRYSRMSNVNIAFIILKTFRFYQPKQKFQNNKYSNPQKLTLYHKKTENYILKS